MPRVSIDLHNKPAKSSLDRALDSLLRDPSKEQESLPAKRNASQQAPLPPPKLSTHDFTARALPQRFKPAPVTSLSLPTPSPSAFHVINTHKTSSKFVMVFGYNPEQQQTAIDLVRQSAEVVKINIVGENHFIAQFGSAESARKVLELNGYPLGSAVLGVVPSKQSSEGKTIAFHRIASREHTAPQPETSSWRFF